MSFIATPLNTILPLYGHAGISKNIIKCNFPLPHGVWTSAFAHRNPPRSLWLRHIHRMCRLTRRAHIPFPLCAMLEGTHGTAPQGDTLSLRIDKYRSLVMSLVRRQKEQHLSSYLYYSSSLAFDLLAALRLDVTFLKSHIPFISTLLTSIFRKKMFHFKFLTRYQYEKSEYSV